MDSGGATRREVVKALITLLTSDPEFLRRVRADPEYGLRQYGFALTADEMELVKRLLSQNAQLSDVELAEHLGGSQSANR